MSDQTASVETTGAALFRIDRVNGELYDCNELACAMLDATAKALLGRKWREAIGVDASGDALLEKAVAAGARTALPPLLLRSVKGGEVVAGGYAFPEFDQGRDTLVLLLFQLQREQDQSFASAIEPGDMVAVLGIDGAGAGTGRADSARLMMDVRAGLQQIVPAVEDVDLPRGATIALVLRQLGIEQAQDVSRALLSHVAPLLPDPMRARIGLALRQESKSSLSTMLEANAALQRLQQLEPGSAIAVSSEQDQLLLADRAIARDGLFSGEGGTGEQLAYLANLTGVATAAVDSAQYLAAVIALTSSQQNVSAVAIYRRNRDDGYDYVSGAISAHASGAEQEVRVVSEKALPRGMRKHKAETEQLRTQESIDCAAGNCLVFPLRRYDSVRGYMLLHYDQETSVAASFAPETAALHYLATVLPVFVDWRDTQREKPVQSVATPVAEEVLDGYVSDNMEGAIDQAVFLARVDVPVAVIGPRGTGKLYVARVIHQEWGGEPDTLVSIDCREFRGRKDALNRISRELERAGGKTLVFKSPHLMNAEAQAKLAKQIGSRVLADSHPPRYIPEARFVALFPDSLDHLVRYGGLNDKLASVFAGYPITVPPIKDRKRAVLRWAHKILSQESARRDRRVSGFTPDAEQAMLQHDWPGNISEMRQCIFAALDKTDKEWLTPVDIGIFKGLSAGASSDLNEKRSFLQAVMEAEPEEEGGYSASPLEELGVALGEALHSLLEVEEIRPLGAWLDDEVVLAACDRFRGNTRGAADFLVTKPRNIGRWMPAILTRDHERSASLLWQLPRKLVKQWVVESPVLDDSPQQLLQDMLLSHILQQCDDISVADRARIMGLSTPTYHKRLQDFLDRQSRDN